MRKKIRVRDHTTGKPIDFYEKGKTRFDSIPNVGATSMDDEPQSPTMIGAYTTLYKGRKYYDTQDGSNQGSLRAERDYLRDWRDWAIRNWRPK